MHRDYLVIELCQLKSKLLDLSDAQYFNGALVIYHKKLVVLVEKLISSVSILTPGDDKRIERLKEYISFLQESLTYLEDSTLNITPYETIFCLKQVLKDWDDSPPIIATSLKAGNYHFKGALSQNSALADLIKTEFDIDFTEELVQIGIPQLEVYNYLYNIAIYHEVGHYIDQLYSISYSTGNEIYYIKEDKSKSEEATINHLAEHFCDLFAAQYVGSLITEYLEFKAENDSDSETHPSTKSRVKVVNDFLNEEPNAIVDLLINAVEQSADDRVLKVRYKEPSTENFEKYLPHIIVDEEELHGVYQTAWKTWRERETLLRGLTEEQSFDIINNLTGKSIANYMIKQSWKS
jgi:hypothetical protein